MLMPSDKISGEVCPESEFSALESIENVRVWAPTRRRWLTGLAALSVGSALSSVAGPSVAWASVARPISLVDLVGRSRHVVIATPRVADSVWENIGGSRRLVTYTRLTLEDTLDDRNLNESEVLVRTLGGRLGALGQIVHGEAELRRDEAAVVFLKPQHDGVFHIAGLSQGHYPLRADEREVKRLTSSPQLPTFVAKEPNAAVTQLTGLSVVTARSLVLGVLSAR
jgi:hypothetical protein